MFEELFENELVGFLGDHKGLNTHKLIEISATTSTHIRGQTPVLDYKHVVFTYKETLKPPFPLSKTEK